MKVACIQIVIFQTIDCKYDDTPLVSLYYTSKIIISTVGNSPDHDNLIHTLKNMNNKESK